MNGCLFEESVHSFIAVFHEVVGDGPDLEVNQVLQIADVLQPLLVVQFALVVLVDQEVGVAPQKGVQLILVPGKIGMRTLLLFAHRLVQTAAIWPVVLERTLIV
jgi:hypothetical protein